jgi:hypothetical protein
LLHTIQGVPVDAVDEQSDRQSRAAKNQSLFREINERIIDLNDAFSGVTETGEWVCECANETCIERIGMSADEYEAIRANPRHFFVAPSDEHVCPDAENVVDRQARYWTVEKLGAAGTLAERADPRNDQPPPAASG